MTSRRVKPPPGAPYRASQLSRLCGISVQTLRFYINEGLLPPPVKTSPNMGWYSDAHVHLIQLIQKLRRERFLPLKSIRTLVQANAEFSFSGDDANRLARLAARLAAGSTEAQAPPPHSPLLEELSEREQTALRLLDRRSNRERGEPDPALVRLWIALRDSVGGDTSFSLQLLSHIRGLVDQAVTRELELLSERIRSVSPDEAESLLDVVIPGLNQIFGLVHERRIADYFGPGGGAAAAQAAHSANANNGRRSPVRQ